MKSRAVICLVLCFFAVFEGGLAWSQTPAGYVISGAGMTLTQAEVKEVFLGDKSYSGSVRLIPVDNLAAREGFLSKVLGINGSKYESIWTKKAFRDALNPPKVLGGDAEIVDFVKRTPGAIGYVTSAPVGVAVIQKF